MVVVHELTVSMVVAGPIDALDIDVITQLRSHFAEQASVPLSTVRVELSAASVRLVVIIRVDRETLAEEVSRVLAASLGDVAAASDFTGLQIVNAPEITRQTITVVVMGAAPSSPDVALAAALAQSAPADDSATLATGVVVGVGGVLVLALLVLVVRRRLSAKPNVLRAAPLGTTKMDTGITISKPIVPTPAPKSSAATPDPINII